MTTTRAGSPDGPKAGASPVSDRVKPSSISGQFGSWLDRRIPPQSRVLLTQRNIFIFPTRTALAYATLLVLLLLGAINYQNSLVYGVAFLLGSLFLVTILHTFRNLSGLTLELLDSRPGFVGDDIEFNLRISRGSGKPRHGIQVGWPEAIKRWVEMQDSEEVSVKLFSQGQQRGWYNPGRLLVETRYPLGLLRAWTWVDLNARALVYPQPVFTPLPELVNGQRDDGELVDIQGSDDFTALRDYQPGDPVKHILWRRYARTDELVLKEYSGFVEPRAWFEFEQPSGDVEERLSILTGWVLQAKQRGQEFGLRLPGQVIEPGVGEAHAAAALEALALFGHTDVQRAGPPGMERRGPSADRPAGSTASRAAVGSPERAA